MWEKAKKDWPQKNTKNAKLTLQAIEACSTSSGMPRSLSPNVSFYLNLFCILLRSLRSFAAIPAFSYRAANAAKLNEAMSVSENRKLDIKR